MKKSLLTDIDKINENINEAERLLKESMSFCEDDMSNDIDMEEEPVDEEPMDDDSFMGNEGEMGAGDDMPVNHKSVDSYIDHIRKYSLNGLSALCDTPDSEEYQMLKKIFQMCDKKPEKKDGINESHRIFGVTKDNKRVIFEAYINNTKNIKKVKYDLVNESKTRGFNPSNIRLVSENKIIR